MGMRDVGCMESEAQLSLRLAACMCTGRATYENKLVPIPQSIDVLSLQEWIAKLEAHPPTTLRLQRLLKVPGLKSVNF